MHYLLLSIFCSVAVGVVFKLARRHGFDAFAVISWNYLAALLLCLAVYRPDVSVLTAQAPWLLYGALALLLPGVFFLLVQSIRFTGIVRTDAAQRLSLFIPILAAWLVFGEQFSLLKSAGILCAFAALFLLLSKKSDASNRSGWFYPLLVLLGYGVIDLLFKQLSQHTSLSYTTSLFVIFCMALPVAFTMRFIGKATSQQPIRDLGIGVIIGLLNFGNILSYLLAHRYFPESPSTVFAGMNMGVILVGSAVGILGFREKMQTRNYVGLALALVSVVLIAASQMGWAL